MTTTLKRASSAGVAVAAALLAGWHAQAEPNRVRLPESLDGFVHYTTVKRGEVTEHIMTTPEAVEAIRQGKPAPVGTHFLLVDYRDGKLYRTFVMEKGEAFGADYDGRRRTADWQFQWFWPDRTVNMSENTARCQSCHRGQASSDFLFTSSRIPQFHGAPLE
jgi:hypothetical protein